MNIKHILTTNKNNASFILVIILLLCIEFSLAGEIYLINEEKIKLSNIVKNTENYLVLDNNSNVTGINHTVEQFIDIRNVRGYLAIVFNDSDHDVRRIECSHVLRSRKTDIILGNEGIYSKSNPSEIKSHHAAIINFETYLGECDEYSISFYNENNELINSKYFNSSGYTDAFRIELY